MAKARTDDPEELKRRMKINNPRNEPIGHFTGRCNECGSKDLWDDVTFYGCNDCGASFSQ
jgi:hypothetical protein